MQLLLFLFRPGIGKWVTWIIRIISKLPKVADNIDIKRPISTKICGNCMKRKQQRKPFYKPMSQLSKYLDYLYYDLGGPSSTTRKRIKFYLVI